MLRFLPFSLPTPGPDGASGPLLTATGAWLPWFLVVSIAGGIAGGALGWARIDARLAEVARWQEERPDLEELIVLIQTVEDHEAQLEGKRWTLDQELDYQHVQGAEIRQIRTHVENLREAQREWAENDNGMDAELLSQINEIWQLYKSLDLRVSRIEGVIMDKSSRRIPGGAE